MSKAVKKAISLPADLAADAEAIARDENKSLSAVVQDALRGLKRSRLRAEFRELQGYSADSGSRQGRAFRARARATAAPLKAVFDTNIFVSALAIPGGQAERAIDLVIDARVDLCISKEIIHEVLGVLAQKFSKGPEELSRTAVFLSELAAVVSPRRKLAVLGDEPDNRILECAEAGHADVIVTGDRAMLNLKIYKKIRILKLRQFLDEITNDIR